LNSTKLFCSKPSTWFVTLTDYGQAYLQEIIDDSPLIFWIFEVQAIEKKGRTEKELCEHVRILGTEEISWQCYKSGFNLPIEWMDSLNMFKALRCTYKRQEHE